LAKIREEDIRDLRERADIAEIVSGYTQLKRAGSNKLKGLCPFHSEKTPSFTVDIARGLFMCFGCGEGGDLYRFVEKVESLPFPEAVEWLARKTGYQLQYEDDRPGEPRQSGVKARLLDANRLASEFFHQALLNSPQADPARNYLSGRGFSKEMAERWQIGYAPGRDSLCKHLLDKGFTPEELSKADLIRKSERDGSLYDSFRQRITFPTWSLQGDVVGFGARALAPDQQPKYLNTSETPVFSKSRVMYGLNKAKSAIARGYAVVVEGYTDVIALHEAGITEAVATNGVALGEGHFDQLRKFTDRIVLMFDADKAGQGAAGRGFGDLQNPISNKFGVEVLVALLPPGRDPADIVQQDGAEAIRKVLEAAESITDFKISQVLADLPLDTPEARSKAVREAVKVLGWHPDPIARREYTFKVARTIGVEPEAVQRVLRDVSGSGDRGGAGTDERERRVPGHIKVEREALQILLTRPPVAGSWSDQLDESDFTSPVRREVFRNARAGVSEQAPRMSEEALSLAAELTVSAPEAESEMGDPGEVFVRLKVFSLDREIKRRRNTLQELNPLNEAQKHDALFTELVGLEARKRDLLRSVEVAG
jgi:DNA primase